MSKRLDTEKDLGASGVFRRRMGIAGWTVAISSFVLGGFEFFTLQADQLWAMLATSSGLLGIGVAKDIWKKSDGR